MPHFRPLLAFAGLSGPLGLSALVALATACTAEVDGQVGALSADAGACLEVQAELERPPLALPHGEVRCALGYPLFLCDGSCPSGELCCVTGARPTGVCRTLDGCADQCAYDCGMVGQMSGARARAICEAFCLAVPPEATCEPGS